VDPSACSNFLAKTIIKGAKNIASYKATPKKPKFIMTLSCLKILGHEIASTDWTTIRKAVCWTACTLAFFGSFRIAEILCPTDNAYSADTLVWSDVFFNDNLSVTITIRHPKSNRSGGERVDVFKFAGHNCCPVKALNTLRELRKAMPHEPVFAFSEKEFLSKKHFNNIVAGLLGKHIPDCRILGHSFRAGIPSALSAVPDLVTPEEIQAWGRWASNSYKAYTRLSHLARQQVFEKYRSYCSNDSRNGIWDEYSLYVKYICRLGLNPTCLCIKTEH
jgi:hypothetical protein